MDHNNEKVVIVYKESSLKKEHHKKAYVIGLLLLAGTILCFTFDDPEVLFYEGDIIGLFAMIFMVLVVVFPMMITINPSAIKYIGFGHAVDHKYEKTVVIKKEEYDILDQLLKDEEKKK
jgi:hypothetical protein